MSRLDTTTRSPVTKPLGRFVEACGHLGLLATAFCLLAPFFWWADNATHFRWQYCVWMLPAVALWLVRKRWWAAVPGCAAIAWHGALLLPLYWPPAPRFDPARPVFTVVLLNVLTSNERYDEVVRFLQSTPADLVVLQEINTAWVRHLRPWSATFATQREEPAENNFGLGVYVRDSRASVQISPLPANPTLSLAVEVMFDGTPLHVLAVHPLPPVGNFNWRARNHHFAAMARWSQSGQGNAVIVGDLNCTPWSPFFRQLLRDSATRHAREGTGLLASWPVGASVLSIPLDTVLTQEKVHVISARTGPDLGSDHRAVIVQLQRRV
ncbi:MAG TPA: endonuclease/exonuclease/phosphatase family protein [Opitutaceae bacterium]|nr:endonuclease/exonuclease/phosphatase family protein [Opitutaceae bacterium]